MEVLNFNRQIEYGAGILNEAQAWLSRQEISTTSATSRFMDHASRFVDGFARSPVSDSTPHLYISYLPLAPRENKVSETYLARTQGLIRLSGSGITQWHDEVSAPVTSDASATFEFSAQADNTWEPHAYIPPAPFDNWGSELEGAHMGYDSWVTSENGSDGFIPFPKSIEFEGHGNAITCVACSPDGTRILSSSRDGTIWVWDACDGTPLVGPFNGHTGVVTSVSFSPDGTRIISGSWDMTIRAWDSSNAALLGGTFEGHIGGIESVAFSPDGARVVSGSADRTVRAWDSNSGAPLASPFQGHTSTVTTVAYSPDGSRIVSGSLDTTIRVWDALSGTLLVGPFNGHIEGVTSVALSPDGTRIVSGSLDRTVRVWGTYNGTQQFLVDPEKGHTDTVTSVTFPPDGNHIVSGSLDRTIRVWRSHDGTLLDDPYCGHTAGATSITTTSDGKRIVSASENISIRVWDTGYILDLLKPPISGVWDADARGWVRDSLQLPILWVPDSLHHTTPLPPNAPVITKKNLKGQWDDPMLGNRWDQCYIDANTTKSV